jgi:hypothetical protein
MVIHNAPFAKKLSDPITMELRVVGSRHCAQLRAGTGTGSASVLPRGDVPAHRNMLVLYQTLVHELNTRMLIGLMLPASARFDVTKTCADCVGRVGMHPSRPRTTSAER